ncbi:MAG TPA: hypothetical protein VM223_23850 [Planctomycetota bacterium]|nr:hypothetical protein [Planctomycetota bacterium]
MDQKAPKQTTDIEQQIEQQIERLRQFHGRLLEEFAKVIVGQRNVLDELLITIFADGHNLLEGCPASPRP